MVAVGKSIGQLNKLIEWYNSSDVGVNLWSLSRSSGVPKHPGEKGNKKTTRSYGKKKKKLSVSNLSKVELEKHIQNVQLKSKTAICYRDDNVVLISQDTQMLTSDSATPPLSMCSPTGLGDGGECSTQAKSVATTHSGDELSHAHVNTGTSFNSPGTSHQPMCNPLLSNQQLASPQSMYPPYGYPSLRPSPYTPKRVTASPQPTSLFRSQYHTAPQPAYGHYPSPSFLSSPSVLPRQVVSPHPFTVTFITNQITKCQGCNQPFRSSGNLDPPKDLVVARMPYKGKDGQVTVPHQPSNSHYHLMPQCLLAADPLFHPSQLDIPQSIVCNLSPSHLEHFKTVFGLDLN